MFRGDAKLVVKTIHGCIVLTADAPYIFKREEVRNILVAEYDYDTDIAVQRAEAGRIAFAEGREQGITQGISQGITQGISQGSRQAKLETAKLLKQLGDSVQKIMQVTGLSKADVEGA